MINTADVKCGERNADLDTCLMYDVGTIQVAVHREDPNPPRYRQCFIIQHVITWYRQPALLGVVARFIWYNFCVCDGRTLSSEILPLGWYLKDALRDAHGSNWEGFKCQDWLYWEER